MMTFDEKPLNSRSRGTRSYLSSVYRTNFWPATARRVSMDGISRRKISCERRRPRLYLPPTPHTIHQRSPALDALYAEWNERVVTKLLVHAESHLVHTVVSTDRANLDELCRGLQRVGSLEIMISDEESMERVNHLEPTE
jgi:hypothetical protein